MATIQFKRGAEAGIPTLADGEPGFTTDTHKLFIGQGGTNREIGGGGGGGGDVTAASNLADNFVVVGDGGAKGVKTQSSFSIASGVLAGDGSIGVFRAAFCQVTEFRLHDFDDNSFLGFHLGLRSTANNTANRTLTIDVNNANRTMLLGGNVSFAGAFTTSGGHAITLTATGATNVTLPTSGTLVTVEMLPGTIVSSVALAVPSWLSVSGSPITSSGTLTVSAASGQTANRFLATPNGSTGSVGLRAIAHADLPVAVACRVGPDATVSHATSGSWQTIFSNHQEYASSGMHSTSTNNERITVPAGMDGLWEYGASITFASNSTGNRGIQFLKNAGGSTIGQDLRRACDGLATTITAITQAQMVGGDWVIMQGYQNSGGPLNMSSGSGAQPSIRFWARYLGRLS